jgi:hypothetical protein
MERIDQLEADLGTAIARQRKTLASRDATLADRLNVLGNTIAAQNALHAARCREAQTTSDPQR